MHLYFFYKNRLHWPSGIQAQQLVYVYMSHTKLLAWHEVSTRTFVVNKTSFASVENQVSRQSYYFNIRSLDVGWFGFFFFLLPSSQIFTTEAHFY